MLFYVNIEIIQKKTFQEKAKQSHLIKLKSKFFGIPRINIIL